MLSPDKRVPLRRNRDFMLLWSGQVVSTIGTRVSSLAYPLLVLALTHSPAKAGLVGFAQTLPFLLFYLPAGALVDRWNRKRVMLVADAARAFALGSIALALALDWLTLVQIAVVAFLEGSMFVFFQLSESAALPHVVSKEQLPTALAQNQAREQGADLAGQPLGGLLFGISHLVPFIADAASYAVSFVTLLFVRPTFQEARPRSQTRLLAEVAEGIVWVWRRPLLRAIVALIGASNFAFNALPLVMIVRARNLGASPSLIGAMFAFLGAGAIVGAAIAPWVQRRVPARFVVIGSLWLWAAGMAVLVLAPNAPALGALAGVMWIAGPPFNVVVSAYRYALVPDRLQARTQSAARLVAWGTMPLGSLAAGFLLQTVGTTTSFLVLAGLSLGVATAATMTRVIRNAPQVEALLAEEQAAATLRPG
ncbi:MAG: MFS transporter [Candidatus Dormibacteraeota bacterium]|nr:MFS transporter [Candidatus Dormibacteraeota bacterium]